jgi:hypothetical protein|tara:strand:- start:1561 stop:1758 length:198 start_codon:yes stop_codon:yes gene_type:complete
MKDIQDIVYLKKFGRLRMIMKKIKKINNFVKKYMDRLHKPVTHVDKKKRDKINKCREKIKVEDVT